MRCKYCGLKRIPQARILIFKKRGDANIRKSRKGKYNKATEISFKYI